jgi:hypothetical protein
MTPEEQADLNNLQTELNRAARFCMNAVRDELQMTPDDLRASGYKSHEQAVIDTFRFYQDRMDKLTKNHLKRYPGADAK